MKSQAMMINAQIDINDMIALLMGLESLGVENFSIEQNLAGALTFIPEGKEGMLNISNLINRLEDIYDRGYLKAQMVEDVIAGNPTLTFYPIVEKGAYHPNVKEINMN